jgi:photosynthetic reaction center H subunit
MGTIGGHMDLAQIVLYCFWIFCGGLIFWLRREDKREGYPLDSDRAGRVTVYGYPMPPDAKKFRLPTGENVFKPDGKLDKRFINATPFAGFPGAPLMPNGDALVANVGPGSYAERADKPELATDGGPLLVPLRNEPTATVSESDTDPRGLKVIGCDNQVAGVVYDVWVDRHEPQIRYIEITLESGKRVLAPLPFAKINGRRKIVEIDALKASQFDGVPSTRNPDVVTKLEEDKISAAYGAGTLYATPGRAFGEAI